MLERNLHAMWPLWRRTAPIGVLMILLFVAGPAVAGKKVKVVNGPNKPVPVVGSVAVEGTVDVNVVDGSAQTTRVQFHLAGAFDDGEDTLGPAPGNDPPQEVTVPDGQTLLVEHVSCRTQVDAGQQLDVAIVVVEDRGANVRIAWRPYSPGLESVLVRDVFGNPRETLVSNDNVRFCAGPGCVFMSSASTWQGSVDLEARRDSTDGFARLDCVLNGILTP